MLLQVPSVLTAEELQQAHTLLASAPWADGRSSAGPQAAQVKNNQQLPHDCRESRTLADMVLRALDRQSDFFAAALPKRVFPPRFNRYGDAANAYGEHIDVAVRYTPGSGQRVRTDLSCTLFLSNPEDYDGGELVIKDLQSAQQVKLRAGDLLVYPGTSVHQVKPVTRGVRLACFFWIESMVRSREQRQLLYEMDWALRRLREAHGDSPDTVALTGTYHNLLRMWADV